MSRTHRQSRDPALSSRTQQPRRDERLPLNHRQRRLDHRQHCAERLARRRRQRSALLHMIAYSPWDWSAPQDTMVAREELLTDVINPQLVALTPGSGTYLNEANFNQNDALQAFCGSNLDHLSSVKKKYDTLDLFYALTAVGSEA